MIKTKKITLYGTKDCPWTDRVKSLLEDKEITKFKFHDVLEDFKAREELAKKTNQYSTPTIQIDNKIIIGFNKEAIESALI